MNKLLTKTYLWMMIGLLVTFITGYGVSQSQAMLNNIFGGWGYIGFVIIEFVLVIFLSARVMKVKPSTAKVMFILYSFVSGLTFSSIFVYYKVTSILFIFVVTAVIYGILSLIGYTTKIDLTKISTYLFMILIGIMIVSIINLFTHSSMLEMILSIICIIVFLGITAYDVQKIKKLENSNLPQDNLAIYCALDLYLDFINIFVNLLQLFGDRDN